MSDDVIFTPLEFRNLTVKNRLFRSNISGRWDNYDGSGTYVRINWEEKFAKGGFGTIITSFVPITVQGRIVPGYAMIDDDDKIPFWRAVGEKVHEHDAKLLMQLSHSGRQQDITGVETLPIGAVSSTGKADPFHGLACRAMTTAEVKKTIEQFAQGARRAREAGLDGVELHGANGYLITQFLSKGINDRTDEYGGSLENRARFVREIIRAIRREAGDDFHVQMKISAIEWNRYPFPSEGEGNSLEDSVQICRWLEEDGADAFHVSVGSLFPHPLNPMGGFPFEVAKRTYDTMLSSGSRAPLNYLLMRYRLTQPLFRWFWNRVKKKAGGNPEGANVPASRAVKQAVSVPVIVTGGFQRASLIRETINSGAADGVSMARTAVANNDLPLQLQSGKDMPDRPCTFCNRCLFNLLENPLGCYEPERFDSYEEMMDQVMSVYHPSPYDP